MADINLAKLERHLKALANRRRLAIIQYLKRQREASVGDIANAIKLSIKATSKHLSLLTAADLLEREQRSLQVFYKLSTEPPRVLRSLISTL